MSDNKPIQHPSHHLGPFYDDPWSPLLDLVTGEAWDEAVRRAERSTRLHARLVTRPDAASQRQPDPTRTPPTQRSAGPSDR